MSTYIPSYVYKITNTITGEFYFGYRYGNIKLKLQPIDDLWVKYFTSSKTIKKIIKEYGVDAFETKILFEHEDSLVCWTYEQLIIRENWNNTLILNNKYHEPDSDTEVIRRTNFASDEAREKMSKAGKGRTKSEAHKQKIAIANTGNIGSHQKREKLSAANTNKVVAIDLMTGKKVKITKEEFDLYKNIKYKGNTTGKITAYNLETNTNCSISKEEFEANKYIKYVGIKSKLAQPT
jgi:hypothetical protein